MRHARRQRKKILSVVCIKMQKLLNHIHTFFRFCFPPIQLRVFAKKNIDSHTVLGEYVGQWFMGKKTVQREGTYSWALSVNGCELFLYSGLNDGKCEWYKNQKTLILNDNLNSIIKEITELV